MLEQIFNGSPLAFTLEPEVLVGVSYIKCFYLIPVFMLTSPPSYFTDRCKWF